MNVHWTDTAQGHLDAIHRYIAQQVGEIVAGRTSKSYREFRDTRGVGTPLFLLDALRKDG
jgi:hypothetical protein